MIKPKTIYNFHVLGGAVRFRKGGKTLTPAAQSSFKRAVMEANAKMNPRQYGEGKWVDNGKLTGPDDDGAIYRHFYWQLS